MKKILGLVLELNPFHNGHLYFINESKRKINPDIVIAVISSSFTMRGDVSVIDKFTKTKLALEAGIDIILELPFLSAMNSADYFGYNAIKILTDFHITDLAFGVELDDFEKINNMKNIIDSDDFQIVIKKYLSTGLSYSTSSYKALSSLTLDQVIIDNFTLPNNTLGIQYLRALDLISSESKHKVDVTLIKRISNNYYDTTTTKEISSATAIRNLLENNQDISEFIPRFIEKINYIDIKSVYENIFYLLKYSFSIHEPSFYTKILGVSEGIENRILSFISKSKTYSEFVSNIQTKRYSLNKIKRLLLHIILETDKKYEKTYTSYLRMLGASDKGLEYLNCLPKLTKSRIITSFKNKLDNELVIKELQATKLYGLITNNLELYLEEFKIPILGGNK